ncbi:hypothetical protein [Actinomadura sp. B10D3]|uniref:hypothetical protein n=1 Tax=Actinomadura sp. B10D3 TaxID=3153557 RepID=UPI00325FB4F7
MVRYGRRSDRGLAALLAFGAPGAGLAIVVAEAALAAHGPSALMENWAGTALIIVMLLAGYGLIVFTQLRYENILVFFGAFLLLSFGAGYVAEAVREQALHERGRTTACTVQSVDRREVTSTDSEGHTTTRVYYDHDLACAEPRVRKITTGPPPAAKRGDRIQVVYDPRGRLHPRPAASVDDPGATLKRGAALFGGGVLLRVLYELRVPPFGPGFGPGFGGLGRRWRTRRMRRSFRDRPPSP